MSHRLNPRSLLPHLALATLLAGTAMSAHAGGRVSVGVNIGVPVVAAHGGPVGAVGLRYVGGPRGGHHGGYRGGPRGHYRGGYHGGYHGGGWGWGLGLGVGLALTAPLWLAEPAPPPVIVVNSPPPSAPVALPVQSGRPDPIIYPRNGQNAQQIEVDRQDCNRWATTQPAAMADASVFQRAVEACMDGRGYTMR